MCEMFKEYLKQKCVDPDYTPRSAASGLGLHYLLRPV